MAACDKCGARNPDKNGHWFGCSKGKREKGKR